MIKMVKDNQEMIQTLQARNSEVLKASDQALSWFDDNPKAVKGDGERLKATLRRFRRQARQLNRACRQPPAIAVFGASQSGKSYLVSSLATKPGKTLEAHYQNEKLNFLQDMNPQGGNESTGLVSRFTTRTPQVIQDNMPVPLRLLSAVDIIKILTNTSLEDFKVKELSMEDKQIDALFDAAGASANTTNAVIDLDDIEGLMEYLQALYPDYQRLEKLGDGYWDKLKLLVPHLPASESVSLFSPLWNGLPQFTNLARSLFVTLEQLGQPDFVHCATDALRPRERSILNVETLFTLGQSDHGDSVALFTPDQKTVTIDRSIVTALTAEITVPVGDAPWSFLEETDLLDFPGARSREIIYDPQDFLQAPEALGRLFLRGKVAYLFQRYEAEREISAMLLCIGDSIQSVSTLPGMIDGWIKSSIGATSADRAKQRDNLFIVLTKFDREFEQKDGDAPSSGFRWTARINASLLDFFKTSSWVEDWKNLQPFNNVYWLRSPAIKFPAIMDYKQIDGVEKESGIASKSQSLVETMKQAYLSNSSIQRYIANPENAWEAVLMPNDGGISYLAQALGQVCDGRLKFEQISAQLEQFCANLSRSIAPYYHSGNKEEAIKKASLEGQTIARSLMKCVAVQMFGPLLSCLQVTRDQMIEAWRNLETQSSNQKFLMGRASDVDSLFQDMFPNAEEDAPQQSTTEEQESAKDRHEQYADLALAKWNNAMEHFAGQEHVTETYLVPSEQLVALTADIALLSRRLNLRDQLADKLRKNASLTGSASLRGETQALLAEIEIGNFVNWLGYYDVPLDQRPMTRGLKDEHVFTPKEELKGILILPEQPTPYNERFVRDWISALVQIFEENAGASELNGIDPAANELLGRIISVLEHKDK
ncbi:Virulence factor SrfC-related protein (SrfC) (PUBMED:31766712) [Commensalibacter communis]|uniref:Virulence factor SrfC-related protein (SrfC) (PUBMED:31766712) n=2 Tax=Commensalibacter communis TaxID=2972786 RepID=A0A9W4X6H5_9PROT|nr:Virulence factor SrfC-related protein (SrfC) (PUBMED:31766712) [Commensalibacter communis]CAI3926486.1 Virulence factor SrfC-related protein (SrfC) (PUBMED:31766712) [Commensalibacter communis]CAI3934900.1 Virulence factor SrfC-related protein (SrfC) (PUBMED:31766712) [Commensalibacter communis]CAI3936500.1 Virulence factor SrfC-related protein (SrfC) (PUBMED:31766712) [Commensalibacter communis]